MAKGALLVGINRFQHMPNLTCCEDDATEMARLLNRDWNRTKNYDCELLTSKEEPVTEEKLRQAIKGLFNELRGGDALFYMSSHGIKAEDGGYLFAEDTPEDGPGYPMAELLNEANSAGVGSILLILDCCSSGELGNTGGAENKPQATIAEGVTILTASSEKQRSEEGLDHSLFTELVLSALEGGAANVRGEVTAAAVYGYVEQSLSFFQQRPMYKSHARSLSPIRMCEPRVSDDVLLEIPALFTAPFTKVQMDPTFEKSLTDVCIPDNVARFRQYKRLQTASLLATEDNMDLYDIALESKTIFLTPLGQFYWRQVKNDRI